jgi:hypothetical protein
MLFQTAMSAGTVEVVYRSVVSGLTVTDTTAILQEGEPVILATATAGNTVGQAVIRGLTVTTLGANRALIGAVHGSISHQSVGLACVYGLHPVRMPEAATYAAFDLLVPDLNTTATNLTAFGRGAWIARTITDTEINYSSGAHVIVMAPSTAVSGTTGVTQGSAFIRAL